MFLETQRDMLTDKVSTLEDRVEHWRYEFRKVQKCGFYSPCKHKKELIALKKVHSKCSKKMFLYRGVLKLFQNFVVTLIFCHRLKFDENVYFIWMNLYFLY